MTIHFLKRSVRCFNYTYFYLRLILNIKINESGYIKMTNRNRTSTSFQRKILQNLVYYNSSTSSSLTTTGPLKLVSSKCWNIYLNFTLDVRIPLKCMKFSAKNCVKVSVIFLSQTQWEKIYVINQFENVLKTYIF